MDLTFSTEECERQNPENGDTCNIPSKYHWYTSLPGLMMVMFSFISTDIGH